MILSKKILSQLELTTKELEYPKAEYFLLPEKVIQFGTGVLLRGLPDYFIDKANKKEVFNGRIVIIKSTTAGDTETFNNQDNLFTHIIKGSTDTGIINEWSINASISRVLTAAIHWDEIMACAENTDIEIIISNTTELGINYSPDSIFDHPPKTFPGKLVALLYRRFKCFNGDITKGFTILPTELINNNGDTLKEICLKQAKENKLEANFLMWLNEANQFCNTLVDRIVPGKTTEAALELKNKFGYADDIQIMSEPYALWAIQQNDPIVKKRLSFAKINPEIIITRDINSFRTLKLHLLNGAHTFTCGVALLSGFITVDEAMKDNTFSHFIKQLIYKEIAPAISSNAIPLEAAEEFSAHVINRFSNSNIKHKWAAITVNYSVKMKLRNLTPFLNYFQKFKTIPKGMALCLAAWIYYMHCEKDTDGNYYTKIQNIKYLVQDNEAEWFAMQWKRNEAKEVIKQVFSNTNLWSQNLNEVPQLAENVIAFYNIIEQNGITTAMQSVLKNQSELQA